jgi:tRNA nucleotidyltransferase (CCA-adding enzyme)
MKEYLKNLPKEIKDLISCAGKIASANSMPIYLVGGFVRDLILGGENLDVDIVVEGDGIKFSEGLAACQKVKLIRHRRFGTATVILDNLLKVDIATARKESYPQPAHLPVVSSGTLKDDLLRRDFTINAMAISISGETFGKLIDFFGGKNDLVNKRIRILHKLSFIDDPTRILRAIRFEQRYDFKIEPRTLECLKEAVKLKMLDRVEPQRIRDDLILILKEKRPLKEIVRLGKLAGFSFINPRLTITKKNYDLISAIERQISWFQKVHHQHRSIDTWLIYFMGLIDSVGMRETSRICRKFAFRKGEEKRILTCKKIKPKLIFALRKERIKPSRIFSFFQPLSYEVIIFIKAKYNNPLIQRHIKEFLKDYNYIRIHVSGEDLRKLGILPGPNYKKIFTKILNAKLNGLVETKEEELSLIKNHINKIYKK